MAMVGDVLLRRAVWSLDRSQGTPPELSAYADGIELMKGLPEDHPLGLTYQAAIHARTWLDARERPGTHPRDWDWCQHAHWLFLPWHRMYLAQFERILAHLIGKPEWRLPYWDYDHEDELRWSMAPEFLVEGSPLYVDRASTSLARTDRDAGPALRSATFVSPAPTPTAGFGGAVVRTPLQHGRGTGQVENTPHNAVHRAVGGFMADPRGAALDPVFWLHHANIDRLWELWRTQQGRSLPSDPAWLDTEFDFPDPIDPSGRRTLRVGDVLDTRAIGYAYDDVPPSPLEAETVTTGAGADARRFAKPGPMGEGRAPELIGATREPVDLRHAMSHDVQLQDPREWNLTALLREGAESNLRAPDRVAELAMDAAVSGRVFLQLEGVRGTTIPKATYDVYVNLSSDQGPEERPDLRAGTYAPFGLAETSEAGGSDTAGFDITDLVARLRADGSWDPGSMRVTFVPRSGDQIDMDAGGDLTVERIGLYTLGVPPAE
jgi:tyrosinase